MKTNKLDFDMAGVVWIECPVNETPECQNRDGSILRATHRGIWNFMGAALHVYRLEDGRSVIDADDAEKFFAFLFSKGGRA